MYVALTPGTAPGGSEAAIRRNGSTGVLTTAVFDGGFDPVSIIARAGDSIAVVITNTAGGIVKQMRLAVAAARPPVVVRTQPPPQKKDLPLNAAIVVVFSEPVAGSTVTSASIHLLHGRDEVPGTPRFLDPTLGTGNLSVEFVPDAPLAAGTTYQLVVTPQVRDLTGDALERPDTVGFTTGQSLTGPPYAVRMSIDTGFVLPEGATQQFTAAVFDSAGHQLTDTPVTWSTIPDPSPVATVSSSGLVHALSPGVVSVLATAGQVGVGRQIVVPFPPPASVTITPANDTIGVGGYVVLTPTVRDSFGRDESQTIRSICWASSNSLVAKFGGSQGPVCLSNPGWGIGLYGMDTGTVTITATVTVQPSIVLPDDTTVTGTTTVTVVSKLASISVTPDSATLVPSSAMRLAVTLKDSTGGLLSGYHIAWASDHPAVATVDSTGMVDARASGTAAISASSDGITGTTKIVVTPVTFASVSAGWVHTCGVTQGGAAYCWGDDDHGELGLGDGVDNGISYGAFPLPTIGRVTFSAVTAGEDFTCGLATAGRAYCWGDNSFSELGRGFSGGYGYPTPDTVAASVDGGLTFATLSSGGHHTCGITTQQATYCWGENIANRPAPIAGGPTLVKLSSGGAHTCGITAGGNVYCWGNNGWGQLGDSTTIDHSRPAAVVSGVLLAAVSAGGIHSCGVTTDSAAYCWGNNEYGQLGDSSFTNRTVPVAVSGGLHFAMLSAGGVHTCGVTSAGTAYCWGNNNFGELGDGTTTQSPTPIPVAGGLTFVSVSAGANKTCAITTARVLYCWGGNYSGMLGDGTTVDRATPVRVLGQP